MMPGSDEFFPSRCSDCSRILLTFSIWKGHQTTGCSGRVIPSNAAETPVRAKHRARADGGVSSRRMSHAQNTLALLRQAEQEGIEVDQERLADLEAEAGQ